MAKRAKRMTVLAAQVFNLPWEPVAKGRPRVALRGGRAHAYTPAPTRHAEAAIRYLLLAQGAQMYPDETPLRVELIFRVRRPKSAPRRILHPTTRPDLDQYVKLALDAATGVLWRDDSAIVEISARKTYDLAGGASLLIEVGPVADSARTVAVVPGLPATAEGG